MTDTELESTLTAAFVPYARGFASDPSAVTLAIRCTATQLQGTLTYSAEDYALLHQGAHAEVDVGRAFRSLSSWNDERTPSLVIESA